MDIYLFGISLKINLYFLLKYIVEALKLSLGGAIRLSVVLLIAHIQLLQLIMKKKNKMGSYELAN